MREGLGLLFTIIAMLSTIAYSILLGFGVNAEWLGQGGVMSFVLAFACLWHTIT